MRSVSRLVNGTYSARVKVWRVNQVLGLDKGKSESTARGNKVMQGMEDGLSASSEREEVETLADLAILTQATYGSRNDGVICALCTPVSLGITRLFARERLPECDKFNKRVKARTVGRTVIITKCFFPLGENLSTTKT